MEKYKLRAGKLAPARGNILYEYVALMAFFRSPVM